MCGRACTPRGPVHARPHRRESAPGASFATLSRKKFESYAHSSTLSLKSPQKNLCLPNSIGQDGASHDGTASRTTSPVLQCCLRRFTLMLTARRARCWPLQRHLLNDIQHHKVGQRTRLREFNHLRKISCDQRVLRPWFAIAHLVSRSNHSRLLRPIPLAL